MTSAHRIGNVESLPGSGSGSGAGPRRRPFGFTMIELVVVMAVLGLLLSLAMPRYMASLERGREQVLQNNLAQMREAIDRFYGDNARYPEQLEERLTWHPDGAAEALRIDLPRYFAGVWGT